MLKTLSLFNRTYLLVLLMLKLSSENKMFMPR